MRSAWLWSDGKMLANFETGPSRFHWWFLSLWITLWMHTVLAYYISILVYIVMYSLFPYWFLYSAWLFYEDTPLHLQEKLKNIDRRCSDVGGLSIDSAEELQVTVFSDNYLYQSVHLCDWQCYPVILILAHRWVVLLCTFMTSESIHCIGSEHWKRALLCREKGNLRQLMGAWKGFKDEVKNWIF